MILLLLTFASPQERDTFEYIYNTYKRLLFHKAYEILGDHMLAEDAVSEAMLRVYKNLHKIQDPTDNRCIAFVVTIVRNVALTLLSQRKKQTTELIDEATEDGFDLEGAVLSDLTTDSIYRLVDQLGEDYKNIFLLKYAYDLPHKEIARLLELSENNVTVRLHRAKKKLAALLQKEGYAVEPAES